MWIPKFEDSVCFLEISGIWEVYHRRDNLLFRYNQSIDLGKVMWFQLCFQKSYLLIVPKGTVLPW